MPIRKGDFLRPISTGYYGRLLNKRCVCRRLPISRSGKHHLMVKFYTLPICPIRVGNPKDDQALKQIRSGKMICRKGVG